MASVPCGRRQLHVSALHGAGERGGVQKGRLCLEAQGRSLPACSPGYLLLGCLRLGATCTWPCQTALGGRPGSSQLARPGLERAMLRLEVQLLLGSTALTREPEGTEWK